MHRKRQRLLKRVAAAQPRTLALALVALLALAANFALTWRSISVAETLFARHQLRHDSNEESPALKLAIQTETKDLSVDVQVQLESNGEPTLAVQQVNEFSTEAQQEMEKQLIYSLHLLAQQTTQPRGIVLPLFDGIATLGVSLIMELRAMAIDLPIEIPHCGDLDAAYIRTLSEQKDLGVLHFYDICERAEAAASVQDANRKLFCHGLDACHRRFRNFDIKPLAVIFSRFEELMLLDADTVLFQDPTPIWESDKYKSSGTVFFHDRISQPDLYLGQPKFDWTGINELNGYLGNFDVTPFRHLATIARPKASLPNRVGIDLTFDPSDQLLSSHAWNHRAGHEMDSSLVFWSKKRQPRATTILGSIIALNDVARPPSYGDKEFYFIACELAETQYTFSDFGIGSVGTDFRDHGEEKSIICGQPAHYYPVRSPDGADTSLLYINSGNLLKIYTGSTPIYYSKARPAEWYAGSFESRGLPQECPFDLTGVQLSTKQSERIVMRQRFHDRAVELKVSAR